MAGILDFLGSQGGGGLLDFLRSNGLNQQYSSGLPSDQAQYGQPSPFAQMQPNPAMMQAPQQLPPVAQQPQPAQMQQPMQQPPAQQQHQQALPPAFGGNYIDRVNAGGGLIRSLFSDAPAQQNLRAQFEAYKAAGMTPDKAMLAVMNPKAAEAFIAQIAPEYTAHNVDNVAGGVNKATGEFKPSFTATKYEKLSPGDNLVAVGGPGGRTGTVATGGPEKPSQGYRWVDEQDTSKGVEAIPGGPGTHLPSETAGRVAMMETGAADLPGARKTLMEGRGTTGTGLSGIVGATAGMGETGRANRTVRIAIEGALRAMTGAAAPEAEVKRYEDMFLPSPFDGRETAAQKLNKLDDFISNAKRLVTQGRGPAGNAPAGRASDPLGIR